MNIHYLIIGLALLFAVVAALVKPFNFWPVVFSVILMGIELFSRVSKSIVLGFLLLGACYSQAQTNAAADIGQTVKNFFANNPTNTWDVSGYGLVSRSDHFGYGGGTRIGYWITPSVGAALDFNYCDSSWTFTSLGLAGRGTININKVGFVSPYASVGAGWNINGGTIPGTYQQSVVAVVGTGATIHINAITWFDFIGEYQHLTMSPAQDRVLFGITRRF